MSKTFLLLKHEFSHAVKRKGFIIMTLAFPMIALIAIGIFQIVQNIDTAQDIAEAVTVGYVDEMGEFNDYTSQPGEITFVVYPTEAEATSALLSEDISEYFVIPVDYISQGVITRYSVEKELEPPGEIRQAMKSFLMSNLLQGKISPEIEERVKTPMWLSSTRLDQTGEVATDQGGFGAFIIPFIFGFLLIMSIFTSSGYLLQGLAEEKENRIMEILLSSISTRQLLTGKVLGLGAAGMIQIFIWLLSITFLLPLASTVIGGVFNTIQMPGHLLILGIVYFILGYLFFAILMASIGAIGASARESSQLSALVTLPAIAPVYVFLFLMESNPDHVIGQILAMIPFTAPVMIFIRLGASEIAVWELTLSIGLMVAAIIGAMILAAKVFRVFLLMYGKTPRLGEIMRLLKQA